MPREFKTLKKIDENHLEGYFLAHELGEPEHMIFKIGDRYWKVDQVISDFTGRYIAEVGYRAIVEKLPADHNPISYVHIGNGKYKAVDIWL